MLKKRVIASIIVKDGIAVQSIKFQKYLPIGKPEISIEYLNYWGIDEIILLDIDATAKKQGPNFELINRVAKMCFVPLTYGGGLNNIEDIKQAVRLGADKICLNTAAIENPELISQAAKIMGNQCIVISIDVKKTPSGYKIFKNSGQIETDLDPINWAKQLEALNAGEIFLNSIDHDGQKQGYDLELIKQVSIAVSIPVIACGGVGHPEHFWQGLTIGQATAVAAGNYFHFTEQSPITTKAFLMKKDPKQFRIDTYAKYENIDFLNSGRIAKQTDDYLEKMRFEYIKQEII